MRTASAMEDKIIGRIDKSRPEEKKTREQPPKILGWRRSESEEE